jgi:hypothetical protein
MSIRYTAMAMTGLNHPSKILKCADKHPLFWDAFADAKAAVIARAEILREYLDSSDCDYQTHSESGDHHYEVSFEYGPPSLDPTLPFKKVFHVYKCTVQYGQIEEIEP